MEPSERGFYKKIKIHIRLSSKERWQKEDDSRKYLGHSGLINEMKSDQITDLLAFKK